MRGRIAEFLLILFSLVITTTSHAQYLGGINLNPNNPIAGDDVTITVRGRMPQLQWWWEDQQFELEGNTLEISLTPGFQEVGNPEMDPFQVIYIWEDIEAGEHAVIVDLYFFVDPDFVLAGHLEENFNVEGNEFDEIAIVLSSGWNLMSINVSPPQEFYREGDDRGPDVIRMMEQLRVDEDNHLLFMLKNEGGRFYLPHVPFNNIPYWELTEGYQVRVLEDCEATWAGEQIPADADIPIDEGWNIIAYFPTYDLPIESPDFYAISPILDHVIMIKNIAGRFAKPDIPFSNMPPLTPGQGYQIRVDEDVMLNYPEEMLEEHPPYFAGGDENGKPLGGRTFSPPLHGHWTEPEPTGRNMSVLVTSISSFNATIGDQVAAFGLDGQLVGVGEFNADGLCGLAVWGDDESTNEVEGLRDGEKFALRLWDNDQQEEKNLLVTGLQVGTLTYETDGFTALETDAISPVPTEFSLASAYPNPFNMATKLKFNLPVESWVNIRVFDIAGKQVTTIFDGKQPAGFHTATWNSQDASSGIYFVKMESSGFSAVRKLVLMK